MFLAGFRWLGGTVPATQLDALFPDHDDDPAAVPAVVLHNAPGRYLPITAAIAHLFDAARERLDVVNPYLTDRAMIRRIQAAARRGVDVRLFVPAHANNWPCAAAQHHHRAALLDAGVRIFDHPSMLHAKAFASDGKVVLAGTCNLDAWSLKRFMEIDLRVRSPALAAQFDERVATRAIADSSAGRPMSGAGSGSGPRRSPQSRRSSDRASRQAAETRARTDPRAPNVHDPCSHGCAEPEP